MIKQWLHDLNLILRNSRKAWVLLSIGVFAALFLILYDSNPKKRLVQSALPKRVEKLIPNDSVNDVIEAYDQRVEKMSADQLKLQMELVESKKAMDGFENQVVAIFGKMLNRLTEAEQRIDEALERSGRVNTPDGTRNTAVIPEETSNSDPAILQPWGELKGVDTVEPPKSEPEKNAIIIPGASVEIEVISGVTAPTDGTPYPTLFRLTGDVIGPNGSVLPLGGALLIGAAQGSLVDSRALFRLTGLALSLPDGETKYYSVDGWVVGEDGLIGMPGIPVDPLGAYLVGGVMGGAIQGMATGVQVANQTIRRDITTGPQQGVPSGAIGSSLVNVDKVGPFVVGSGLKSGAEEWQRLLRDRVKDMVPVIKVYSGRKAHAVFDKPVIIEGLYRQIAVEENEF